MVKCVMENKTGSDVIAGVKINQNGQEGMTGCAFELKPECLGPGQSCEALESEATVDIAKTLSWE